MRDRLFFFISLDDVNYEHSSSSAGGCVKDCERRNKNEKKMEAGQIVAQPMIGTVKKYKLKGN